MMNEYMAKHPHSWLRFLQPREADLVLLHRKGMELMGLPVDVGHVWDVTNNVEFGCWKSQSHIGIALEAWFLAWSTRVALLQGVTWPNYDAVSGFFRLVAVKLVLQNSGTHQRIAIFGEKRPSIIILSLFPPPSHFL
jgi:hypothetical protein